MMSCTEPTLTPPLPPFAAGAGADATVNAASGGGGKDGGGGGGGLCSQQPAQSGTVCGATFLTRRCQLRARLFPGRAHCCYKTH